MNFLIQSEMGNIIESFILKDVINQSVEYKTGICSYKEIDIANICNDNNKNGIPVGDIEFIEKWLNHFYNKSMIPIEIPQILRTPEFLKREYKICTPEEFPSSGRYFIKNADKLKDWSYCGNIENIMNQLNKDTNYVVSEEVNILSEWRIYVISGQIENTSNYDGDPTIFPDVTLIKKAITIYSAYNNSPKSYSIDVMVTSKGTSIIEIHPFAAIGLYSSLWDISLARAYKDGIDYYIQFNP